MSKIKVIEAVVERYKPQFSYLNKNEVNVEDKRYGKPVKYVAQVKYQYRCGTNAETYDLIEELEIRLNMDKILEEEAQELIAKVKKLVESAEAEMFEDATEALKFIIDNIVNAFENYERYVKLSEITSDYPKGLSLIHI